MHLMFSFSNVYDPVRQEKHLTVLEHLLSALNIFLRSVATNCRMRLCHLGEELVPSMLCVWADMRPSEALKEEIVEFFNLQICAHHPKGAKTQDTGRVILKPFLFSLYGTHTSLVGWVELYCSTDLSLPSNGERSLNCTTHERFKDDIIE